MAYRGGNIDITVKGDYEFNLNELDFVVLVYPDRYYDEVVTLNKSDMENIKSNMYSGTIGYEVTKTMPLGQYTIEVLIKEGNNRRSIYAKQGAFPMYESASEDIE